MTETVHAIILFLNFLFLTQSIVVIYLKARIKEYDKTRKAPKSNSMPIVATGAIGLFIKSHCQNWNAR